MIGNLRTGGEQVAYMYVHQHEHVHIHVHVHLDARYAMYM